MRFRLARAAGAASTWLLTHLFGRAAANFPGKVGLYVDPQIIAHLRPRIAQGAIVVVGTNGKTTVTNLLADALQVAGRSVACNRTGANLDSGIATTLLHAGNVDWAVLESDELWLAKVLPQLKPDYVVLLNLFRDQLDRVGEIEHVQAAIAQALSSSPATTLVYNVDDPLCQQVADRIENKRVGFGVGERLGLPQNAIAEASICRLCDTPLEYAWRQYGQLGAFACPNCGYARVDPLFVALCVRMGADGVSFDAYGPANAGPCFAWRVQAGEHPGGLSGGRGMPVGEGAGGRGMPGEDEAVRFASVDGRRGSADGLAGECRELKGRVDARLAGAYSVYNLLAGFAAASMCGVTFDAFALAARSFAPENGRLQEYVLDGHRILLNLAKNPTGFNQNLKIVAQDAGQKALAVFINDREADGRDVSWLWDVDFWELAACSGLAVYAGGMRRNDLQVRLKYAGVDAQLVDDVEDFLARAHAELPGATLYVIANYTALPSAKQALDHMGCIPAPRRGGEVRPSGQALPPAETSSGSASACKLVIAHMLPELLNLYGDGGNVAVLAGRARGRGIDVEVVRADEGCELDFEDVDIVFLGGGPDREQRLAAEHLLSLAGELRAYVEDDGVMLAICGGYQIIGRTWLLGDEAVPGLGLVGIETRRARGGSHDRLIGDVALRSFASEAPLVGYENHAGRTYLDEGLRPLGRVIGKHGRGNNGLDGCDGVVYRNVIGTYLHGPALAKNPELADYLLQRAYDRRLAKQGRPPAPLARLDDAAERAANAFMCSRLGLA